MQHAPVNWHVALHPGPGGSHCSGGSTVPFPHTGQTSVISKVYEVSEPPPQPDTRKICVLGPATAYEIMDKNPGPDGGVSPGHKSSSHASCPPAQLLNAARIESSNAVPAHIETVTVPAPGQAVV
jgi:hypothetical protein